MTKIIGLEPIIAKDTRILVLGSFPSAISLGKQEYYANPRNIFWKIIGDTHGKGNILNYEKRVALLQKHKISLWDIYRACEREGSLDTGIKNGEWNNFESLRKNAPHLKRICFNGMKAGQAAFLFERLGYEVEVLPSTSPANAAMPYATKLDLWKDALTR